MKFDASSNLVMTDTGKRGGERKGRIPVVRILLYSLLTALAFFGPPPPAASKPVGGHGVIVKGRVIDSAGKPSPDAEVVFLPVIPEARRHQSFDEIIESYPTDKEGRFSIKIESTAYRRWVIYIVAPHNQNSETLVGPPFDSLRRNLETHYTQNQASENVLLKTVKQAYSGREVNLTGNTDIDLGDLPVQVEYSQVLIHLLPLTHLTPSCWLRIRDAWGDRVEELILRLGKNTNDTLALSLPMGEWVIGLTYDPEMDWRESTVTIPAHSLQVPVEISINMSAGTLKQRRPYDGDAESARRELAKAGFEYSNRVFVARAERCNSEIAQLFLRAGMSPNAQDEYGNTALIGAVRVGCQSVSDMLLKNKADVNLKDKQGATALDMAVIVSNEDAVKRLITAGAKVNEKTVYGETALVFAVMNNSVQIVRALISAGADVNVKYRDGKTVLQYAAEQSPDIKNLLEQAGARN